MYLPSFFFFKLCRSYRTIVYNKYYNIEYMLLILKQKKDYISYNKYKLI